MGLEVSSADSKWKNRLFFPEEKWSWFWRSEVNLLLILTSTGLQDNPWVCDCRLYDLVHLLDGWVSSNLIFIEARLRCASPRSLAGVAFSQLELRKCQSPELRPGVTSIISPLGSTVLLRCGATGIPGPEMSWRRANGRPLNGTGVWATKWTVLAGTGIIQAGLSSVCM